MSPQIAPIRTRCELFDLSILNNLRNNYTAKLISKFGSSKFYCVNFTLWVKFIDKKTANQSGIG